MTEIKLRITQERLERFNIGMFRRANRGDIDAMCNMLAHFMVDESGYMDIDAANAVLDAMEFGDLSEAVAQLRGSMQDAAAPKATAPPSTS